MSKILGKCPYCKDGRVEVRAIQVQGAPLKLYACTNAHWHYESDFAELTSDSTCGFRIFQNQLRRWNKKAIGENEIRTLLKEQQVKVRLYSANAKKEYFKWIVADREYGVSVVWDEDV
ncbi:hypothetical protein [Sulfurimonas sp. HSL-1716]|uniref:hypothetical protein n=1 Tax=Hydrocurvibacter sulfurireducens TaxID=3131937 RepID=UPI0031FA12FB